MSLIDRLCLPDEWRCFVVAASCPVCLRPRRLRLRRRCTLSSHSSTPSKRSNPCDVLTLARRHTAAMCVRCSSPLSSFLRCFMTEISSAASRVRLSRRRRSKLRGGRGGRGGREGGERQEQTGRPALARPRAVRQTLPPPSLFSPPRRRSRCGGNTRARVMAICPLETWVSLRSSSRAALSLSSSSSSFSSSSSSSSRLYFRPL